MTAQRFDIRIAAGSRILVDVRGFPLTPGGITILFGESGIGKSLIGKSLFGIADRETLNVRINGEGYGSYMEKGESTTRRREGFFVFQEPSSHLNPLMTLDEQALEGDLSVSENPVGALQELWPTEDPNAMERILPVYPTPYRPSGGEKQRILAGMAFEKMDAVRELGRGNAGLFVFDEPTGSLDREARDRFLERLFTRHRRDTSTILLITHDYSMLGYIRKHHPDLEKSIRLLDLSRVGGQLTLTTFDPRRYLDWVKAQRPRERTQRSVRPFLTVESGVRVFGRTFEFRNPETGNTPCSLQLRQGDLAYLTAGSGVGKTTLVKIVMGLQRADYFRMMIDGTRLGEVSPRRYWRGKLWGKKMTMAFQHADEALNPRATVEESLAILPSVATRTGEGRFAVMSRLFDPPVIPSLLSMRVSQLSGGQKQRLNLLRAFALSTPLLILDEPLNALDFDSIGRVLEAIEQSREAGQAILLISHNEDIFQALIPPERTYRLVQTSA